MSRSRDQEQGQEAYPDVPEVQDAETWARQRYPESDQSEVVMKLTNERPLKRQTVNEEGERSQTSRRVLWQFSQKSFIMSHPSESRVTNPCILYNAVFLWWPSSCNKTQFHFIYILWCTQLHSEIIKMILRTKNIENIVQINTIYNTHNKIRGIVRDGFVKVCSTLHRL